MLSAQRPKTGLPFKHFPLGIGGCRFMAPLIHHNPQPAVRTTNPAQSLQFGSIFNKLHNIHCQEGNLEALALLPCLDRFQLLWSLSVILSSFRLPWPFTPRRPQFTGRFGCIVAC